MTSALGPLACGDDGGDAESGMASGTAVDSTGGGDELPSYEYDGEPGPPELFSHAVASGDPLSDSVILWTRVTTDSDDALEAFYEVALDPQFEDRVAADYLSTAPDRDHTIKLDLDGLSPGTTYYYRFYTQGVVSPVGRTRTAPQGAVERVRFALCSCASLAHGYFHTYRRVAERADLDLVIHLGDYIYEYGVGEYGDVRTYEPAHEIVTLDDYRTRYDQYRRDADLQELHRQHPVAAVWDDHESTNNSYKDGAQNHTPDTEGSWDERKAIAYQVYAEWMPLREGAAGIIYRALAYGDLVHLMLLDTRLIGRDAPPEDVTNPELLDDPSRQLLGAEQESWLSAELSASTAHWRLVGQQVVMSELLLGANPINPDQWDGYRAARQRFFDMAKEATNVVVLTGDIHSSWAFDLAEDPDGDYSPGSGTGSVGVEFVVPGVTSPGLGFDAAAIVMAANPHLQWVELESRGYVVLDVDEARVQASWWFVADVTTPEGGEESLAAVWATYEGTNYVVEEAEAAPPLADPPPPAP